MDLVSSWRHVEHLLLTVADASHDLTINRDLASAEAVGRCTATFESDARGSHAERMLREAAGTGTLDVVPPCRGGDVQRQAGESRDPVVAAP